MGEKVSYLEGKDPWSLTTLQDLASDQRVYELDSMKNKRQEWVGVRGVSRGSLRQGLKMIEINHEILKLLIKHYLKILFYKPASRQHRVFSDIMIP